MPKDLPHQGPKHDKYNNSLKRQAGAAHISPSAVPVFGTYCRSMAFEPKGTGRFYEYYEAFQDEGAKGTWTVSVVNVIKAQPDSNDPKKQKERIRARTIAKNIKFTEALTHLAAFEMASIDPMHQQKQMGPDVDELGFDHYIAFAEREGYIFDIYNVPHPMPANKAVPTDSTFSKPDIERANKRWAEAIKEQNNAAGQLFKRGVLTEMFARASGTGNFEDAMNQAAALYLIESFMESFQNGADLMQHYIKEYKQLEKGHFLRDAIAAFDDAEDKLPKLEELGVETVQFSEFLEQCRICCLIIHAQGMFNLNKLRIFDSKRRESADEQFAENQNFIRIKQKEAEDRYRQAGANEREVQLMKAVIVQGTEPEIPPSIPQFIANYRARRAEFEKPSIDKDKPAPGGNIPPAP